MSWVKDGDVWLDAEETLTESERAIRQYESEGMDRSDAQGCRMADVMSGRVPPDPEDEFEMSLPIRGTSEGQNGA